MLMNLVTVYESGERDFEGELHKQTAITTNYTIWNCGFS